MDKTISINVPILARVEGEGALELTIHNNKIQKVQLKIYEPPRLFEKFLENRSCTEVLDIVPRICGICPVAYQMSAAHAIENCFGIQTDPWIRNMRKLFYCGEWIESHSLHIHMLALPDFLGLQSAPEAAKKYPEEIRRGLRLQSFGNELICLLGGRSVHPVGACLGGFYHAPSKEKIEDLLKIAEERIKDCEDLICWLSSFNYPDSSQSFTCVSLYHPSEYPMNEGNIISDNGLNITIEEFDDYFKEFQVPYSNALHCKLQGKTYLVGPLARVNNCFEHLPDEIKILLKKVKIIFPNKNMHLSIIARAVEIYYCVLEALKFLKSYNPPKQTAMPVTFIKGEGYGCTEAPRGMLWHHYKIDEFGKVTSARIGIELSSTMIPT